VGLFSASRVIDVKGGIGRMEADRLGISQLITPACRGSTRRMWWRTTVTEDHQVPLVLRSGSYRGLGATANNFARETHMDSLAQRGFQDPLEFVEEFGRPANAAVLENGSEGIRRWPRRKTEEGQGFGVVRDARRALCRTFAGNSCGPKGKMP